MAKNPKNKFPADRSGTKYSEFRNTKRIAPGKVKAAAVTKSSANATDKPAEAGNES